MTFEMVVQLPVTGAFGTDEEFDLRTQLERDFNAALAAANMGESGRGETDDGRMSVYLEAVTDPDAALRIVKDVLARHKLLHRAMVLLDARCEADSDDIERRVLWPLQSVAVRVA
ncbi:hypothetical protein J8F10_20855 [Gemmata sp. G18]|uniref:Uncharacterized protein n=1 Tax=Gemmata palustris TaxID=2822762 RepID=A0ABS5BVF9_9BACT|nr:hypothetical protein [Gemmata palustris]MBP3957708.1 hypothetical protein [Gemmata palustris]